VAFECTFWARFWLLLQFPSRISFWVSSSIAVALQIP
jgi:hypothetical protein